jgi:hypothetical protein
VKTKEKRKGNKNQIEKRGKGNKKIETQKRVRNGE